MSRFYAAGCNEIIDLRADAPAAAAAAVPSVAGMLLVLLLVLLLLLLLLLVLLLLLLLVVVLLNWPAFPEGAEVLSVLRLQRLPR